ncbi:MAG: hypothetical protein ABH879_01230 [archaeon]
MDRRSFLRRTAAGAAALPELVWAFGRPDYRLRPTLLSMLDVPGSSEVLANEDISGALVGDRRTANLVDVVNDQVFTGTELHNGQENDIELLEGVNFSQLKDPAWFDADVLAIAQAGGYSKERIRGLGIRGLVELTADVVCERMRFYHFINLWGIDDITGDGVSDGISISALNRIDDNENFSLFGSAASGKRIKEVARQSPSVILGIAEYEAERIDNLYADEIFAEGKGVCRHYSGIMVHAFDTLIRQTEIRSAKMYLICSWINFNASANHAWNIVAAKDRANVFYTAVDASEFDQGRSLEAFVPGHYDAIILQSIYGQLGKTGQLISLYSKEIDMCENLSEKAFFYAELGEVYDRNPETKEQAKECFREAFRISEGILATDSSQSHREHAEAIIHNIRHMRPQYLTPDQLK